MDGRIRVIIIDDDPMVRTAVRMIMATADDVEVVGEAGDGRSGLVSAREHRPDVILCDIRMPDLDGIALLEEMQVAGDRTPVIMLTTFNTDDYVVRTFRLGAQGFLLKDADPREMVQAVRDVHAGHPALSTGAVETLIGTVHRAQTPDAGARARVERLTEREREVAVLLASGASNARIALQTHMAVATVKATMSRIFTKLEVDNRVSAAMTVRDAGLA